MTAIASAAGSFRLGDRVVHRMGYGAMQLAGPGVFGPPKDRAAAVAVLREAVESGVNHIDTSDFYGPHITNQLIAEALHPYPDGLDHRDQGRRGARSRRLVAARLRAGRPRRAMHDNLRNLRAEAIDVVNLRIMGKVHEPSEGSIEPQFAALAKLPGAGPRPPSGFEQCRRRLR